MRTFKGSDGKSRCNWCSATDEYIAYHDNEWGFPVDNDIRLFEKICLESFQSGLSWRTILAKRDNFRKAFENFDYNKVALYTEKDIQKLLNDEGIVRHRGKIEAVINNAQRVKELIEQHASFAAYVWKFEPEKQLAPQTVSSTAESTAMSKELKKMGWKFVGPTTIYAFMQSMGLVNDHETDCYIYQQVEKARKSFKRPHK